MNKEEAIKYGTEWLKDEYLDARDGAFIEIALEALEQEPCDDAISRKLVCAFLSGLISDETERKKALQYINELPPVNPQTKTMTEYEQGYKDGAKVSEEARKAFYQQGWDEAMAAKWTSVSDRLPEKGQIIAVAQAEEVFCICKCIDDYGSAEMNNGDIYTLYPEPEWGDGYAYWTPLPRIHKGGEV